MNINPLYVFPLLPAVQKRVHLASNHDYLKRALRQNEFDLQLPLCVRPALHLDQLLVRPKRRRTTPGEPRNEKRRSLHDPTRRGKHCPSDLIHAEYGLPRSIDLVRLHDRNTYMT